MFNQTLRSICSFFAPGKKSIFSANNGGMQAVKKTGEKADQASIRLLYHRDIDTVKPMESKPETMQHDWWIN